MNIQLTEDQQQELKGLLEEAHGVLLQIAPDGENAQCEHLQEVFNSIEQLVFMFASRSKCSCCHCPDCSGTSLIG